MAIVIKKDGRVYVRYRKKGEKKLSDKYFGKGLDAKAKAKEFNDSLKLRAYDQSKSLSPYFVELFNAYIKAKASKFGKDSMKNIIWKMTGVIIPTLGGDQIRAFDLTSSKLDEYVNARMKHVKKTTIHREISDVRAILNWAVERKFLTHNPMIGFTMPTKEKYSIVPPSTGEIEALIAHAKPHLIRALCLHYFTGLRPGLEMKMTSWGKFDCCNRTLTITSANKEGLELRRVPIKNDRFFDLLIKWYHEDIDAGLPDDIGIVNYRGKSVRSIKKSLATAKRLAGINRKIRPYDLRHVFATIILKSGGDLKTTSQLMGHSRPDTTVKTYQHVDNDMSKSAVSLLPGLKIPQKPDKQSSKAA